MVTFFHILTATGTTALLHVRKAERRAQRRQHASPSRPSMHGWMHGWMHGCMDGCMCTMQWCVVVHIIGTAQAARMAVATCGPCMRGWMHGWIHGCMHVCDVVVCGDSLTGAAHAARALLSQHARLSTHACGVYDMWWCRTMVLIVTSPNKQMDACDRRDHTFRASAGPSIASPSTHQLCPYTRQNRRILPNPRAKHTRTHTHRHRHTHAHTRTRCAGAGPRAAYTTTITTKK